MIKKIVDRIFPYLFRLIGIGAILCGIGSLFLAYTTRGGAHDLSFGFFIGLYLIPTGIGLIYLRKVFAILLGLPLFIYGSIFIYSGINDFIKFILASLLFSPIVLAILGWHKLK